MVAFAIFDSRRVTLSLEERASAPEVQDGKGLQLLLLLLLGQLLPSGLLNHIRGDEMRKEEATSARRWQNNRTKDPIPISAVVTLPPSSLSPPPRVFALRERVHPIFPGVSKHCPHVLLFPRDTSCPVVSTATRALLLRLSYTSRAPEHRNLDTSSSTNVGPHVPHWPHPFATAPRSPPREIHATYMTL